MRRGRANKTEQNQPALKKKEKTNKDLQEASLDTRSPSYVVVMDWQSRLVWNPNWVEGLRLQEVMPEPTSVPRNPA